MNVRLQYPTALTAGVHYDGQLRMNNYNLRVWMITNSTDGDAHNIAYERLKLFISQCLESSVFINHADKEACRLYHAAGIKLTTLPEEPIDQIIGMMLYCKLNAIMEDQISVVEVEISSELGDRMIYMHSEQENLGPFSDNGWWNDSDPIHWDSTLVADDKIMNLNRISAWRELGLQWPEEETPKDTGNTIIFTDFNRNETK